MKTLITLTAVLLLLAPMVVAQESTPAKPDTTAKSPAIPAAVTVADIQVCTSIANRTCEGGAANFDPTVGKLYCLTEITHGAGDATIKHIWSHAGKVMAEVPVAIHGSRWRTWSSKTILASWTGEWSVKVVDANGTELKSITFTVGK